MKVWEGSVYTVLSANAVKIGRSLACPFPIVNGGVVSYNDGGLLKLPSHQSTRLLIQEKRFRTRRELLTWWRAVGHM